MSNAIKLAPLTTPEEALRTIPMPRLVRSTNISPVLSPSDAPIPQLVRSTNTPPPSSPLHMPPILTRSDERRRVTLEEIESAAKKLW
jgi:hypothetical protein